MKHNLYLTLLVAGLLAFQYGCGSGKRDSLAGEAEINASPADNPTQKITLDRITCDRDYYFSLQTGREYYLIEGELEIIPLKQQHKRTENRQIIYNYSFYDFKKEGNNFITKLTSGFNFHYLDTGETELGGRRVDRNEFNMNTSELTSYWYWEPGMPNKKIDNEKLYVWEILDRNNDVSKIVKNDRKISKCSEVSTFEFQFFPFKPNPRMFEKHVNSLNWKDGSKRIFNDLTDCKSTPFKRNYMCSGGFLTRRDRLGDRICRLDYIQYNKGEVVFSLSKITDSCRWK